jgi:hypothetical protein
MAMAANRATIFDQSGDVDDLKAANATEVGEVFVRTGGNVSGVLCRAELGAIAG